MLRCQLLRDCVRWNWEYKPGMPHVDQQRVCKYNINIRITVLKFSRCQQRRRNNATETCVKHLANSKVIPIIHIRWWLSLQVQILISDLFFIYHSWKDGKWNSNLRSITFKLIETVLQWGGEGVESIQKHTSSLPYYFSWIFLGGKIPETIKKAVVLIVRTCKCPLQLMILPYDSCQKH